MEQNDTFHGSNINEIDSNKYLEGVSLLIATRCILKFSLKKETSTFSPSEKKEIETRVLLHTISSLDSYVRERER